MRRLPASVQKGFTLVEVLVISPIIILFIGAFIALAVGLTGESLQLREKNTAVYDVQATLNIMEASVVQTTGFMSSTTGVLSPQGKNNSATQFTNVNNLGADPDTLILKIPATTRKPTDPTRNLIYTGTGACDSKNPIYAYTTVFFVDTATKTLYKRTILPQQPACDQPWQRGSCAEADIAGNTAICKTQDEKLLDNVEDVNITYYADATSTTPLDATTQADTASSVSIDIKVSKQTGGATVDYTSSLRTTSLNVQTSEVNSQPPAVPSISWSRDTATPYTTTFTWDQVGSATGYKIRYRMGSGTWVDGPQNQTPSNTSYSVVANARKQNADIEVSVITTAGTYLYGTMTTTIPNWQDCVLQNGWGQYGNGYSTSGFTKTTAGVVGLKGLIYGGSIGTVAACTLPVGFRPSQRISFQVGGYQGGTSGAARVDIATDGQVQVVAGESPWVSLSGIVFLASDAGYTWTSAGWLAGWVDWGGYGTLSKTIDSQGRAWIQGLGQPGTYTSGTIVTNGLTTAGYPPSHFMHMPSRSGSPSAVSFWANGQVGLRGVGSGFNSLVWAYYPATFNSWNTLSLTNGWVNYNATSYSPAQCYKGADDLVVIRGLIKSGANGTFTGPLSSIGCGSHTEGRQIFPAWMNANSVSRVDMLATGQLNFSISNSGWTSIDNVRFISD